MSGERNTLLVHLNKTLVGRLRLLEGGFDATEFRLDQSYLETPSRPTLGQTFLDDPDPRTARVRLPAFFSNLLPEGVLRELLAQRAGVNPAREFFLIGELGGDLPGAVLVRPEGEILDPSPEIQVELPTPVGIDEPIRFSVAGIQLKMPAEKTRKGWRLPVRGQGGRWLLKLPDRKLKRVPRNEWAMMTWAGRAGLAVPQVQLIELNKVEGLPKDLELSEQQGLLVRRFDRDETATRTHMEDFLQILDRHPDGHRVKYSATSYDALARIIASLGGALDLQEYVRRLTFNIIIGNSDAHLKNWSLWYPDTINARLSPAYDLVSTIQYIEDKEVALNLNRVKRYADLKLETFTSLAKHLGSEPSTQALGVSEQQIMSWVVDTVAKATDTWPGVARDGELDKDFIRRITDHWKGIPLMTEAARRIG